MSAAPAPSAPAARAPELAEVAIIGVGVAGISVACKLQKAGIGPVVALEKGAEVGGTWSINRYPGAACDVPAHLYSLSFAWDFDWSRNFATQAELLAYLKHVVTTHKLLEPAPGHTQPVVRLSTEVQEARWDGEMQRWAVRAVNNVTGEPLVVHARFLVTCLGRMAFPQYPSIPGAETFTGPVLHTARWRQDVDLKGKRVAVVGTGASAVQVIPAIAGEVAHLTVFQRSPPHVLPKMDYAFSAPSRFLLRLKRLPLAHLLFRNHLFWTFECFHGIFANPKSSGIAKIATAIAAKHLQRQIPNDPELRAKLTPSYSIGCRRILLSNTYFPALSRPTTTVVTSGIQAIKPPNPAAAAIASTEEEEEGETKEERRPRAGPGSGGGGVVVDGEGREHAVDVLVYATGFRVKDAMDQVKVVGLNGLDLQERFRAEGWSSYLGVATQWMPNFLQTMGSHTSLGHNSMICMMECQTSYIVSFIKQMRAANAAVATLKPEVEEAFMREMKRRLDTSVWQQGDCDSYYITKGPAAGGDNDKGDDEKRPASDMTWPGSVVEYWRRTRKANLRRQFDAWGADGGRLWA